MTMSATWGASQTQYFYELTPENLLDAIEQALGRRSTGRILTLNSMENRVYEVELENAEEDTATESVIAKFYRPGRWQPEQIAEEHQFLADLIADEISAIAPLPLTDGKSFHRFGSTDIMFAIFPKLGGRSPDELAIDDAEQVGRLIARMHNVGHARLAHHRVKLTAHTYGEDSLRYLVDHQCIPAELASAYVAQAETMLKKGEPFLQDLQYQRIHGDAHLGNLLRGRSGFFWVDFDDMVIGPAVQDLWLLLPSRDSYGRKQLASLLKGYRQMRDFDERSLRAIEILRALRMLHFSAWIARRWEDPAFPRAFPQFGSFAYWRNQLDDFRQQCEHIDESDFWLESHHGEDED
jgi:Ser/Thr protein kinase RdoA (MazF antagonist)